MGVGEAAALFATAFRRLKPRSALPAIEVEFRPFANVNNSIRLHEGRLHVRLSDVLQGAPPPVVEAIAVILLCKLYRQDIPARYNTRYRLFLNRKDVRRQVHLIRQVRGRKQLDQPVGRVHSLEEIFQELNQRYFNGLLGVPVLSWSRTASRTMLGHFDPAHNTIIISRLFDSPAVPRYALEYLMYHEMLHLKYPVEHCGSRRRVHSNEFQSEEQRFSHYEQARRALKRL